MVIGACDRRQTKAGWWLQHLIRSRRRSPQLLQNLPAISSTPESLCILTIDIDEHCTDDHCVSLKSREASLREMSLSLNAWFESESTGRWGASPVHTNTLDALFHRKISAEHAAQRLVSDVNLRNSTRDGAWRSWNLLLGIA